MRLDAYLAEKHPEYSRSTWAKYIKLGYISIDKKVVTDVSFSNFSEESNISIDIPENNREQLDLPVVYEDKNVIVINKPAGVLTHSKGALNDEFTVSDFISNRTKSPELSTDNRFGIVHRLDRATSGVIIGAKNEETRKMLQKQFQDRKTKKTYVALVDIMQKGRKTLDENGDNFAIDLPIARNPKTPSQFRVDAKGKDAITNVKLYKVLGDSALLELKPYTGRTHQLRVHLAHIGLPIVGDPVYNNDNSSQGRMMLHAEELEITIPKGQRRIFKVELPDEFKKD